MLASKAVSICWRGRNLLHTVFFVPHLLPLPPGEDTDTCNKKQLASVGEGKTLPQSCVIFHYFLSVYLRWASMPNLVSSIYMVRNPIGEYYNMRIILNLYFGTKALYKLYLILIYRVCKVHVANIGKNR